MSLHLRAGLSLSEHPQAFDPGQVAPVAAGYWYDPSTVRNSGASIVLPEMNGRSAYDMATPAANTAPTAATVNGQAVLTFANGTPDQLLRTSVVKQRGFTGAAMIWGWFNTAGPNVGTVFGHVRTALNFYLQLNTSDVRLVVTDGGGAQVARFDLPPGGYAAGPFYYEGLFLPAQGIAADRMQLFIDRVRKTPTVDGAANGSAMTDTAEFLTFGGSAGDNTTGNYNATFSVGCAGIANGIPTDGERDALFAFRRLK